MVNKPEIWLGDWVRVVRKLKPADELSRAKVVGLLGFKWHTRAKTMSPTSSSPGKTSLSKDKEEIASQSVPATAPPQVESPKAHSNVKSQALHNLLTPLEVSQFEARRGINPWKAIKPLEEVTERHLQSELPYESLFKSTWSREVLAAIVAEQALVGEVDIEQLVRIVAKGAAIETIPQLSVRTLSKGVQLLIDNGVAMEPFRRDQMHLVGPLKAVVGASRVEEVYFSDCPTRGCFESQGVGTIPYALPGPGTPVLVLSDLGIGGPALHGHRSSVLEWIKLARQLENQGSSLIALVPYPKQRWDKRLTRSIIHVPWDRSTSLSRVLEILR